LNAVRQTYKNPQIIPKLSAEMGIISEMEALRNQEKLNFEFFNQFYWQNDKTAHKKADLFPSRLLRFFQIIYSISF
jgi:hypothetical protein